MSKVSYRDTGLFPVSPIAAHCKITARCQSQSVGTEAVQRKNIPETVPLLIYIWLNFAYVYILLLLACCSGMSAVNIF